MRQGKGLLKADIDKVRSARRTFDTDEHLLRRIIYKAKLGDKFLIASMFVAAEEALANLGLAAVQGDKLSVVVGGLGLG